MPWKCVTSNDAEQTIVLADHPCALETIVFNTRGTGSLKIYDSSSNTPDSSDLFAEFDLANTDLLIQYLGSGVELDNGLAVEVPTDPGNFTICWKQV